MTGHIATVLKTGKPSLGLQADVAAAKSKPPDRETGRALLSLDVGNNPWSKTRFGCQLARLWD